VRFWQVLIGVLAIVGGVIALMNPLAATLTAEQMTGWIFVFIGIVQIVGIFTAEGFWNRVLTGVLGVVFGLVGISLLNNPLTGILSLTIIVAILFLAGGIFKLVVAISVGVKLLWPVALSGVVSLILAFLIFANFPASAATILGLLLAVELISTGVSLVYMGLNREAQTV